MPSEDHLNKTSSDSFVKLHRNCVIPGSTMGEVDCVVMLVEMLLNDITVYTTIESEYF